MWQICASAVRGPAGDRTLLDLGGGASTSRGTYPAGMYPSCASSRELAAQQLHALRAVVQDLAKQQHHSSVFEAAVLQRTAQDITSLVLEGWSTDAPHTTLPASAIKHLRGIRRYLLATLALAAIQYKHAAFLVRC